VNKVKISVITPFLFCLFISNMALFFGENAQPSFYAFLPVCFLFAAVPVWALLKKVDSLEKEVEELKRN